ncbi:MAG: F0F1 ATP synthase subunit A [Verrucomicrobiales bacterium]
MELPLAQIYPVLAAVSIKAQPIVQYVTNSIFVALLVVIGMLLFVRRATRRLALIPGKSQNLVEFAVEFLYGQVEGIVGPKVAKRAFPLLATIFLYTLISNWVGLLPGVGTIGFGHRSGPLSLEHIDTPLLRPATADLNMTLGMAAVFMIVWFVITMIEAGPIEFLKHIFGPKGGLTGFMKYAIMPIFFFVGVIEVISIVFRPVSLSLRLYGNIYAGETLLHTMGTLGHGLGAVGGFLSSIIFPLPFYFMEILVGMLQATVFTLLCAVYIQLSTAHDEEHH